MDCLYIKGLAVSTHIGVYAWEQQIRQPLLIDLTIRADFSACDEQLANTIDYDKLCQGVTHFVESKSFQLIETIANQVAQFIKNEFMVKELTVSISKPHAIKNAANIQVTISR